MSSRNFPLLFILIVLLEPAFAEDKSIVGLWDTSFGRLRLIENNNQIIGVYNYDRKSRLGGQWSQGKLIFVYEEAAARGEGEFQLSPDGMSFAGKWRPKGSTSWQPWTGNRAEPRSEVSQLILLEGEWETGGADYSFGSMLKSFFARESRIEVLHQPFTSKANLLEGVRASAFLAEPAIVVIAAHGSSAGIRAKDGDVGVPLILSALKYSATVKLLHFSACEIMSRDFTTSIPTSGYLRSVDWTASAIAEFMYFDLILNRGLMPKSAWNMLEKLMPFTGVNRIPNAPFESLGFKFAN